MNSGINDILTLEELLEIYNPSINKDTKANSNDKNDEIFHQRLAQLLPYNWKCPINTEKARKETFHKILPNLTDQYNGITKKSIVLLVLARYTYGSIRQLFNTGILGSDYNAAISAMTKYCTEGLISSTSLVRGIDSSVYALTNKGLTYLKDIFTFHDLEANNIRIEGIKKPFGAQLEHKLSIRELAYTSLSQRLHLPAKNLTFEKHSYTEKKPIPDSFLSIDETEFYFEQDMGTQSIKVIIDKLLNYEQNDYHHSDYEPGDEFSSPGKLGNKAIVFLLNSSGSIKISNDYHTLYNKLLEICLVWESLDSPENIRLNQFLDYLSKQIDISTSTKYKRQFNNYISTLKSDDFITKNCQTLRHLQFYKNRLRLASSYKVYQKRMEFSEQKNYKRKIYLIEGIEKYFKTSEMSSRDLYDFLISGIGFYFTENTDLEAMLLTNFPLIVRNNNFYETLSKEIKAPINNISGLKYQEYSYYLGTYHVSGFMPLKNIIRLDTGTIIAVEDITNSLDSFFRLQKYLIPILCTNKLTVLVLFKEEVYLKWFINKLITSEDAKCIKDYKINLNNLLSYNTKCKRIYSIKNFINDIVNHKTKSLD